MIYKNVAAAVGVIIVYDEKIVMTLRAKDPGKNLLEDLALYFQSTPKEADFVQTGNGEHGRIETRKIWVTTNTTVENTPDSKPAYLPILLFQGHYCLPLKRYQPFKVA